MALLQASGGQLQGMWAGQAGLRVYRLWQMLSALQSVVHALNAHKHGSLYGDGVISWGFIPQVAQPVNLAVWSATYTEPAAVGRIPTGPANTLSTSAPALLLNCCCQV